MRRLWHDPALCRQLGAAARLRATTAFNEAQHIGQLINAYHAAIGASPEAESLPKPC
jgi:hypothetical protein